MRWYFSGVKLTILFFLCFVMVKPVYGEIRAESISIDIQLAQDGIIRITETSRIKRHHDRSTAGWYRVVPSFFHNENGQGRHVPFTIEHLRLNGESRDFKTVLEDDVNHVIMFSPNVTLAINGHFEVEFTYITSGHIFNKGDYQELFLDLMGPRHFADIDSLFVNVKPPDDAQILGLTGYCDGMNRNLDCGDMVIQQSPTKLCFTDYKGSSIPYALSMRFPQDTFLARNDLFNFRFLWMDHGYALCLLTFVILVFGYFMWAWNKKGMGPAPQKLGVRKSPPKGLGPGLMTYLVYEDESHNAGFGSILELAVRGALKINYSGGDVILLEQDDVKGLPYAERVLLHVLFSNSDNVVLNGDTYNVHFHRAISAHRRVLLDESRNGGYSGRNFRAWLPGLVLSLIGMVSSGLLLFDHMEMPMFFAMGLFAFAFSYLVFNILFVKANKKHWLSTTAIFLLVLVMASFFTAMVATMVGWETAFGLTLLMGQGGLFYKLMAAPSKKGRAVLDEVDAYKEFLKNGMETSADPVDTFSRHLPYAAALALDMKWIKQFRNSGFDSAKPLSWYSDDRNTDFGAFIRSEGPKFLSALISSIVKSSSAGGDSGYSVTDRYKWGSNRYY